jgi:hypothetical protein
MGVPRGCRGCTVTWTSLFFFFCVCAKLSVIVAIKRFRLVQITFATVCIISPFSLCGHKLCGDGPLRVLFPLFFFFFLNRVRGTIVVYLESTFSFLLVWWSTLLESLVHFLLYEQQNREHAKVEPFATCFCRHHHGGVLYKVSLCPFTTRVTADGVGDAVRGVVSEITLHHFFFLIFHVEVRGSASAAVRYYKVAFS